MYVRYGDAIDDVISIGPGFMGLGMLQHPVTKGTPEAISRRIAMRGKGNVGIFYKHSKASP